MTGKLLESGAISAFCSSVATMLAAGVQTDEATHMLAENREQSEFKRVCDAVYSKVAEGSNLADAMEATGAFPAYATETVRVGEASGRTERVLRSLGRYYDSEGRAFAKLRNSVGYPAALLCIMSVILVFTVAIILPIFSSAYENLSGSMTSGSFNTVGVSIAIGWIALAIVLVATVAALYVAICARNESGRNRVTKMLERYPGTPGPCTSWRSPASSARFRPWWHRACRRKRPCARPWRPSTTPSCKPSCRQPTIP